MGCKYKLEAFNLDNVLFNTIYSNNLDYLELYKNRTNYRIKIFQKISNKWKIIYSELK